MIFFSLSGANSFFFEEKGLPLVFIRWGKMFLQKILT